MEDIDLDQLKVRDIPLLVSAFRGAQLATRMAYSERASLVAFLSRVFESHWSFDPKEPDFPVVCIHTPEGQMAWHIAPADVDFFDLLSAPDHYDGHSTKAKYDRLSRLTKADIVQE
jgi:hypothetical protein